ncbi:hypothetical protein TWF694_009100 [Orbilia ellipsospora]|uniref:Uncharacterized protein n=1 Tax=Orbilia ellipsospora TaxID=2528407 RepID=A0AAV9XFD9_9PEZI
MLFLVVVLGFLGHVAAQSCSCQCTLDDCVKGLQGTTFFAPETVINDCRNLLWTKSTVFSTTINLFSTVTVSATVTESATTTTKTDEHSLTDTNTQYSTETATSTLILTITQSQTITNTVTSEIRTTETVTAELTTILTSAITETSQISDTQTTTITSLISTTLTSVTATQSSIITVIPLASVSGAGYLRYKRQETVLPTYASACPNQSAYISACTCIGITLGGTIYIQQPSTVITSIVTTYVTVTQTQPVVTNEITLSTTVDTVTKTIIDEETKVTATGTLLILISTQVTTQTTNITTETTETVTKSFTTTVSSVLTSETTNTLTLQTTRITTIIEGATTTLTTVIPYYTEFAIQATEDIANGDFKGQYLFSFKALYDNNVTHVALTSDITLAGRYASDPNGNVTGLGANGQYGLPFSVYDTSSGNDQLYEMDVGVNMLRVGCWVDSAFIFQCQGAGRKYISGYNSTSEVQLYSIIDDVYTGNSTGPLVLQAVPIPTAGATATTPSAVAKSIIIQVGLAPYATGNPFAGRWWDTILEGATDGSAGTNPRLKSDTVKANAKVFLVDPATGNIASQVNEAFWFNSGAAYSGLYSGFADLQSPGNPMAVGCTLHSNMNITCVNSAYEYLCVYSATTTGYGELRIYDAYEPMIGYCWVYWATGVLQ